MDKFLRLKEEREKLEHKKQKIESVLQECKNDIANKDKEMGQYYADFFMKKVIKILNCILNFQV